MFTKLALKNIRRSIKDYAIYFFTLVLGVAIFYVFNSLESQSVMLDVTERVKDMLKLMNVILGVVSVFVSVILGALIIYASRFLIKRRSKEFGLYMTLGMGKRKISRLLLIETFLIGVLSLVAGLALGIIASQFTSVLVANMFDADLTNFQFVFSGAACLKTLVYFGVIYLAVMIFSVIIIGRQKLINLLSSNRRNEKVALKNPWVCTIVFTIASVMLGYSYYLVTAGLNTLIENADIQILLVPIAIGVTATFLLFWSLSGLLLRIVMSFKKIYYSKLNSFILRQFGSKINTTVVSMSLICLMLFTTICILGSALSINHTMHETAEKLMPVDIQVIGIGEDPVPIPEIYQRENVNLSDWLEDITTYETYRLNSVILGDVIGSVSGVNEGAGDVTVMGSYDVSERFIHQSDYNRAAKVFGHPEVNLADGEYAMIADFKPVLELRNQAMKDGKKITVAGKTLSPNSDQCIVGGIELQVSTLNEGIIIVPDSVNLAAEAESRREVLLANYKTDVDPEAAERILYGVNNRFYGDDEPDEESAVYNYNGSNRGIYYFDVESRQDLIDNNVGTSALVTFVGLYLGIIFLISSAAVLALKELSESSDNRAKYTVLRKIGASEKMLNRALFWQIFIFFLFPLLIAILHAVFGLQFCDVVLISLGGIDITSALPAVAIILGAIYGGYFLITYLCSKNIIRDQRN